MVEKGNRLNMGVEFKNDSFICPGEILWSIFGCNHILLEFFGGYNDHITSIVVNPLVTLTGCVFVATHFVTGDLGDLVRAKSWSTNMSFATTMAPVPGISGTEEIHEASPSSMGHGSLWCFSVVDLVLLVFLLLVENVQCHMMSHVNENRHWNWDVSQGLKSENPKHFCNHPVKSVGL